LDTSSKNKNKWRWFIGIIVGIIVVAASCYTMRFVLATREVAHPGLLTGTGHIWGKTYVKYVNGVAYYYESSSDSAQKRINLETAEFLAEYGDEILLAAVILCMFLLVCFLRSRWIWKNTETIHRKGIFYTAELLIVTLCCLPGMINEFSWYYECFPTWQTWDAYDAVTQVEYMANLSVPIIWATVVSFICFWWLRPLFKLGMKGYLKEYSLICFIVRSCVNGWRKFKTELAEVDFGKKPVRILRTAVLIQFGILLVCVCCWFVGIPLLIVYSVALFFFLNRQYKKAENGYFVVLKEVEGIADGNLNGQAEGDFGMLRPLGTGLSKIKNGFRKAVEKEVKSERMKTELITNVSHDLKTPLTAILTYVELLKREDLTEEERASYIGTLEQKSNRLKVLIEDLFEVSRAASNNIELQQTEVDLVKLVKQVAVEHEEQFTETALILRQTMPEEECKVYVDGQKTYRIFENLFSNICKYAMPGSRVYVRVYEKLGWYYAELKNMSAMELTVAAEELTERFVRGDSSRNTEGSGLGLAIAKNLTTLQGGSFRIETDGDLFKVELGFPKLMYAEDKAEEKENLMLRNVMAEEEEAEPQSMPENDEVEILLEKETTETGKEEGDSEEQKAECDSEEWMMQEEESSV